MMSYTNRFKELLLNIAKGFGIGALISLLLTAIIGGFDDGAVEAIKTVLGLDLLVGSAVAMIISSRAGIGGHLASVGANMIGALTWGAFTCINLSPIGLCITLFKLLAAIVVLVPVSIFLATDFILTFLYYGTMTILEKTDRIDCGGGTAGSVLDAAVPMVSAAVTVVGSIVIFMGMLG